MIVIGEGCIIDGDYLINVKDHMIELLYPRRRLTDYDGTRLPLISVDTGRMQ